MKLTRAASYAIHALTHMAREKGEGPLAAHVVARARGIPEGFLLKVLRLLVSAGMLRSVKGANGGYRLHRKPAEITLLDVVEAVEGPVRSEAPFTEGGDAALHKRLDAVCQEAAEILREHLRSVSLADLIATKGGRRKAGG